MEGKSFGCIPSPVDVRDYKINAGSITTSLPEEFELDFKHRIKDQGMINSCVAHATSSILEYHSGMKNVLSTNFIYGIQHQECDHDEPGMYLRDACKIVNKYGDMLDKDCPGNDEVPRSWSIAEKALKDAEKSLAAAKYKIRSYYSCRTPNDIKYALFNYGPVLICIKWHEKYDINEGNVITFNQTTDFGYHAIMIYGWTQEGFLCQNSWGKRFGKDGCFVLPYSYPIAEAKALIDLEDVEDEALVVPNKSKNELIDVFLKMFNFILNIFSKKS